MNRSSLTWPFRRRGQPVAPAWRQDASLPDVPRRWQRAPEPWERWETSLVLGSLLLGCVGLVLLGWLVARFILP